MKWLAFVTVIMLSAWLEESHTRRAEIGVTLVVLFAVLAYLELING